MQWHDTIDSTSLEARRLVEAGRDGREGPLVVLAREQVAGRGRDGRVWSSPAGGVWMTLMWPAAMSPPHVMDALGLRVGLALTLAIERSVGDVVGEGFLPAPISLKWPNDVLLGGRKVAGALTEVIGRAGSAWILVGCGVNADLDLADLPSAVSARAPTLRESAGPGPHAERVRRWMTAELESALARPHDRETLMAAVRRRLHGVGESVVVRVPGQAAREAVLIGIEEDGRAIFEDARGRFTAASGVTTGEPD